MNKMIARTTATIDLDATDRMIEGQSDAYEGICDYDRLDADHDYRAGWVGVALAALQAQKEPEPVNSLAYDEF